jgi:hypothetical protein
MYSVETGALIRSTNSTERLTGEIRNTIAQLAVQTAADGNSAQRSRLTSTPRIRPQVECSIQSQIAAKHTLHSQVSTTRSTIEEFAWRGPGVPYRRHTSEYAWKRSVHAQFTSGISWTSISWISRSDVPVTTTRGTHLIQRRKYL